MTSHVDVEPPLWARHDSKKTGGESQPEERHGLAVEVLIIDPRRKTQYGGAGL
jgi:hypothetical protein